jgi:hypothetical protein
MALTRAQILEQVAAMKELQQLQKELNSGLEGYVNGFAKLREINDKINDSKELEAKLQAKINTLTGNAQFEEQQKLNYLVQQRQELEKQGKQLSKNLDSVSKTNLLMKTGMKGLVKGIVNLPNMIEKGYGKIKSLGLFEMDKAIKQSSLSMGLLSTQSNAFRSDIMAASRDTLEIGVGIEELAKMQAGYSEELGRSVMLNKEGLKAISEIAVATGLGAEGAAKMAADMEKQGLSAEKTAEFINQTMTDATKMGLNASKVVKNIQSNIKMLNKYNFKGGVKGLKQMAETVTKLGVDMTFATGMADKLFDIEGAVDMSAQLQVMGGAWAKLADPFHLMYMARNDMAGLTEEIGKAAESSVTFNKKSGEFEISAMEMHRLRKIAEQTGVAYEDLAEAGKNARKQTEIRRQMRFSVDDETKEFLANTAKFTEKGEAYIEVKGEKKMLKTLSEADRTFLKNQLAEKKNLEERAKDARTFDEALVNLINQFKVSLMPLIDVMSNRLIPKIDSFVARIKDEGWLDKISEFGSMIGKMISFFGGWIIDNPIKSAFIYGSALLIDKASWVFNGLMLAKGFLAGTKGGGGGGSMMDMLPGGKSMRVGGKAIKAGKYGKGLGMLGKGVGKAALPLALLDVGLDALTNATDDTLTTGEKFVKTLDQHKFMATGAIIGSIFPVIGTAVGAGIGGLIDMFAGEMGTYGEPTNDGIFNGKGKSNFSKGRAIVDGGKITPIDNKDELIAAKKGGVFDNAMSQSSNQAVKHEFDEIKINGELVLSTPGGEKISTDILKDPQVIRQLTRMIHAETQKVANGGKTK